MAYYLQQQGQNLLVSKEIRNVFQTDRFEIINLSNKEAQQRIFTNIVNDFVFQVDTNHSSLFELRLFLFNRYIPLERIFFNLDDLAKDVVSLLPMKKRVLSPVRKDMAMQEKIDALQDEFENKIKRKINNVLE